MIDVEVSALAGTASDENLAKHHIIAGRISLAQKIEWFCTFRIKSSRAEVRMGLAAYCVVRDLFAEILTRLIALLLSRTAYS